MPPPVSSDVNHILCGRTKTIRLRQGMPTASIACWGSLHAPTQTAQTSNLGRGEARCPGLNA
eukprot:81988-Chlamydomonas_euryale.AAC.1